MLRAYKFIDIKYWRKFITYTRVLGLGYVRVWTTRKIISKPDLDWETSKKRIQPFRYVYRNGTSTAGRDMRLALDGQWSFINQKCRANFKSPSAAF